MFQVEITDKLTAICNVCLKYLTQSFIFRLQCIRSNEKLQLLDVTLNLREIIEEAQNEKDFLNTDFDEIVGLEEIEDDKKEFICEDCSEFFSSESELQNHMSTHKRDKTLECDVCGRKFTRSADVKRHMALHTGIELNNYIGE